MQLLVRYKSGMQNLETGTKFECTCKTTNWIVRLTMIIIANKLLIKQLYNKKNWNFGRVVGNCSPYIFTEFKGTNNFN